MDYNSLIEEISSKYSYSEELKIAIRMTLPLMVETYGESRFEEICDLFRNTKIFATDDMSKSNRDKVEQEMLNGTNSHVTFDEGENPYQNDIDPGSYYSYQAIYDENMDVVDEKRWAVVKDMQGSLNGEEYKNLFGTTINMPYFIHEMNHAFAMQNATYRKEGNLIYSKHGMVEQEFSIDSNNGTVVISENSTDNIIIEEAINEKISQDMLTSLLKVEDYSAVDRMLRDINHITTSYSPVLISLAEKMEGLLGRDALLSWRKDNNMSVLQEFNRLASESEISQKYCDGMTPYDYFDQKCFGIFLLKCNGYKMSMEEYGKRNKELMVEAFAPLCAYQDKKLGTMSLEKFENIRNGILGIEVTNGKENVTENQLKRK